MPGSIGWQGLIVILLVALIIFGPKRLPEMGRSLGRGMREFKESVTGDNKHDDEPSLTAPEDEASVAAPRPQRDPVD
jgi:sec-independent protein translocase protein TatA